MKPIDHPVPPVGSPAAQEAIRRSRLFPVDSSGGHLFVAFAGGLGALRQINVVLDENWIHITASASTPGGVRVLHRDAVAMSATADDIEDRIGAALDIVRGYVTTGPSIRASRRRAREGVK